MGAACRDTWVSFLRGGDMIPPGTDSLMVGSGQSVSGNFVIQTLRFQISSSRPHRSCPVSPFLCPSVPSATADRREGKGHLGGTRGRATQPRLTRGFLAAGLFCNCSQIMLAPAAILGTALVLNHILYLILILFLVLSWIQEPYQQTLCAGRCPRGGTYLGKSDIYLGRAC